MFKRLIASLLCLTFSFSNLQYVHAQDFSVNQLPVPGTMIGASAPFVPLALKGLVVNLQKPLEFQFIVDTGKGPQDTASIKEEANQLVKYFLAGLTIPEGDLWVNLSPYEKDRMVPTALGQTDLGRDLLAQDYILKQLTASLIYPEKDLGKEFWSRVYAKAQAQFGTTNVPVNTFNKVWILPDQAQVFENHNAAYVTKSTLKVMLDEDYLAKQKHQATQASSVSSQIVREIVIPEITKEVNTGKNFAPLRQIYQALILAKWYKETIQNGLLDAVYTNKNKVAGVNLNDPTVKEQIYERYLKAYKKGAFNYIKEDPAPDGQVVPRKYFSGGTFLGKIRRTKGNPADIEGHDGAMVSVIVTLAAGIERGEKLDPYVRSDRGPHAFDAVEDTPDVGNWVKEKRSDAAMMVKIGDKEFDDPKFVAEVIRRFLMEYSSREVFKINKDPLWPFGIEVIHSGLNPGGSFKLRESDFGLSLDKIRPVLIRFGQTESMFGIVEKSKFSEAGPNGAKILDDLIKQGILEKVSSGVRLKRNKGESIDRPLEMQGSNFDEIWNILQNPKFKDISGAVHWLNNAIPEGQKLKRAIVIPEIDFYNPKAIEVIQALKEAFLDSPNGKSFEFEGKDAKGIVADSLSLCLKQDVLTILSRADPRLDITHMALQTGRRAFKKFVFEVLHNVDPAMAAVPSATVAKAAKNADPGGIDLNQINVLRRGKTVNVQFDPAQLRALEQGGFEGFTPVIINITPISSPFQLLGIAPHKQNLEQAQA